MTPVIFISAGEASGEQYGALLASALSRRIAPKGERAELIGMGGPRMEAAGVTLVVRSEDMAVMGMTEVVHHLPHIYREFQKLKRAIRERRPDVAVLIDFPEIHFRLAKELHRLDVPVVYFVSPQLWAWKKKRIRLVEKYVDKMLVIFPFEEPFYREHGVQAEFVGHPLAELPLPAIGRAAFAAENGLDPGKTWIGLLPGSRPKEIRDHLPQMLRAARELSGTFEFVLPLAPTLSSAQRDEARQIVAAHGGGLALRLVGDARDALFHARASIVASGTATVEAALIGNPFVVVYRVSALTYAIVRRMVKVPHVAMVNLIAGKRVVPELIQGDFTAARIVAEISRLIPDGPPRQTMIEELARVHGLLQTRTAAAAAQDAGGPRGAIERAAAVTLETLRRKMQPGTDIPGPH